MHTAVQRQKAVSAYFTSKQILPFAFAEQYIYEYIFILSKAYHSEAMYQREITCHCLLSGHKLLVCTAMQSQKAVTAYSANK